MAGRRREFFQHNPEMIAATAELRMVEVHLRWFRAEPGSLQRLQLDRCRKCGGYL